MKIWKYLVVIAALLATTQIVDAGDEPAWWDMANCDFCVNMSSAPGLMDAMQWESHKIADGSISMVQMDEAHLGTFKKACAGMKATQEKAMSGAEIQTCGMCSAMGRAMMAGANVETVDTSNGQIHIMTSDNAEVVEQLHMIVQRNQDEMKKMMAPAHDGHGHSHDGHSHGG